MMIMKKRYFIGVLALLTMSCSGFLKEYSQDMAYVRSYTDLDELLIGSGYLAFDYYNEETIMFPYLPLLSDETRENISGTGTGGYSKLRDNYFGYYTWQERVDRGFDNLETVAEDGDWNSLYEHINVANMVLSEIGNQSSTNASEAAEISRIRGEAFFLRGMYYFWLVNLYGKPYETATAHNDPAVPLKLTEYIEDKKYTRNTVQEVYDQILADLGEAEDCLKNAVHKSIYRADLSAVYLLQSRVHLYMRNWTLAKAAAEEVLRFNDKLVDLNTFSGEYFLTPQCAEIIFSTGSYGLTGDRFSMKIKDFSASQDLIDAFKANDLRSDIYLYTEYPPCYPCNKYDNYQSDISDICVFRTPEAYLNLAEACFYLNDEAGACAAINTLRKNRFQVGSDYEITATGKDLIETIRDERFRELCFEGHRWYDLRRYVVDEKYPLEKTLRHTYTTYNNDDEPIQTSVYELQPGDPAYTLPIPKEVRAFDDLITNNPRNPRNVVDVINY